MVPLELIGAMCSPTVEGGGGTGRVRLKTFSSNFERERNIQKSYQKWGVVCCRLLVRSIVCSPILEGGGAIGYYYQTKLASRLSLRKWRVLSGVEIPRPPSLSFCSDIHI